MSRPMPKSNRLEFYQRNSILAIIILTVVTLCSFSNIFANQFVWDDFEFIVDNPSIRSLNNIPLFFQESVVNLYRPLRTTLYAFSYALFETNPLGYHIIGLLLHLLCVGVLYFIFFQLSQKRWIGFLAAALFAVHPIHTESVTFITASFDLLGPLFFLLSFYFWIQRKPQKGLCLFLYLCALLSSEMTITLPPLLFLYNSFIKKNSFKENLISLLPFILMSFLYFFIRFNLLEIGARDSQYLGGSALTTFLTMTRTTVEYLRLLLWPIHLLADYRHVPLITNWQSFSFLIPFVVWSTTSISLFIYRQKYPWIALSWFWFWVALLPVSNLIPTGNVMAERYLYIPSIAVCFILIPFFNHWHRWKGLALSLVLIFCMAQTYQRNFIWKNELTLWTTTVLKAPTSYVAHNNLASYYMKKGFINNAYDEIQMALKLKPDFVDAYTNLGALCEKRGMLKEAEQAYQNAIALNPNHASALSNLGNVYLKQGDKEKAIEEYKKSKSSNANFYLADYNLGNVLFEEGKLKEAEQKYQEAISIQPLFPNAHYNLSILHTKQGKIKKAIEEMKQVVKLLPNDLVAKQTLKQLINASASSYPYAKPQLEEKQ